jgi:FtsP/CotA-like multicopper oxidase with cupredoxin domain
LGKNLITGKPFNENTSVYTVNGPHRIGPTYIKALYREYTDNAFTHLKPILPRWQHLGILGPVINAEVGDTIKIVFKNNAHIPYSMHPHGLLYEKSLEGAPYNDGINITKKSGDIVQPGKTFTYIWQVPTRAGPGPGDPSSIMWMYHSHVDEVKDTNSGLVGPIIITRHGEANPDGTPRGVDREFVVLYTIFNENNSHYLGLNMKKYLANASAVHVDNDSFVESNLKHSINGFLYGNLKGLNMKVGEKVRWYMMGMGTEADIHVPHWHGNTLLQNGMRTDTVQLLPMTMSVLDMNPDNPGTWLFHCSVNDHILAGMLALYTVSE